MRRLFRLSSHAMRLFLPGLLIALIGGAVIGLVEAGWSAYFEMTYRDIVVFGLLIALFVLRPGGLLGFAGPQPREV